ncbi:uncharacterized protein LOC116852105 [Odontomachus brunneus]|nr:uncharacterized protein LOC116852105 [Odontomachus brunneus]
MRDYASASGAKYVSALRGTTLRKHIATKCVDLNLSDRQVTRVANFMGHHEHIHKEIYRQPVAKVDILEMSKILEKAQGADIISSNEADSTYIEKSHSSSNQDISQRFDDSETFAEISIETQQKKSLQKENTQRIEQKEDTQNRKKHSNILTNIQNIQKKDKGKGTF